MEGSNVPNNDSNMTPATFEQLKACQFSSWYPKFRSLNNSSNPSAIKYPKNNVTIRSIIISPLPETFMEYLKSDGVILPKGAQEVSSLLTTKDDSGWSSDEDEDGTDENHTSNSSEEAHFPELNQQIQSAIDKLGPCMPKLNWSAPKDVTWLNGSTLKCCTIGDVYLLLKSSDFCMFDLEHALDDIDINTSRNDMSQNVALEYELILRKWSTLHSSMEFRCFVTHHELVGICQRNHTQHYPHLKREYMEIRANIADFFDIYIRENFADALVSTYVFDVYVDKDERVWLIDFNLWNERTDALMFTWEELVAFADENKVDETNDKSEIELNGQEVINIDNVGPEMRVVMNGFEVHYDPLASYRAPIDAVDLASDQAGSQTFKDFMNMCSKPSELDVDE